MRGIPSMADGQGSALGSGSIPDAATLARKNYNQLSSGNTLLKAACREMGAFLLSLFVIVWRYTKDGRMLYYGRLG